MFPSVWAGVGRGEEYDHGKEWDANGVGDGGAGGVRCMGKAVGSSVRTGAGVGV